MKETNISNGPEKDIDIGDAYMPLQSNSYEII